jgi:hypothetical protein
MGPHSEHIRSRFPCGVTALCNYDLLTTPVATLGHSLHKLGLPPAVSCFTSQGAYLPVHFCTTHAAVEPLEIDLVPPLNNGTIGPRFVDQYTRPLSQLEHTFYLWLKMQVRLPEVDIRKARLSRSLSSVRTRSVLPPNIHNSVTRIRLMRAKHTITDPLIATKLDLVRSEGHNVGLHSCQ